MKQKPGPKTGLPAYDPVKRVTLTIDDMTRKRLDALGGGNVSRGVRNAARAAYDLYQRTGVAMPGMKTAPPAAPPAPEPPAP